MLKLKEHQIEHFDRLYNILLTGDYYLDFSKMGTGKTIIATMLARLKGLKLAVLCPVSAISVWRGMEQYGARFEFIMSYQSLRGSKQYPPKCGYLTREDITVGDKVKVIYKPTQLYLDCIQRGILLIFDECQNLKNKTDQTKAARCLSTNIKYPSKCGFLSGSPYDKETHCENMLRLLGIIREKYLLWVNPSTREIVPKGVNELVKYCEQIDPGYVHNENIYSITAAKKLCHQLFTDIIRPTIGSEMVAQVTTKKITMEEAHIVLNQNTANNLKTCVGNLATATRFNGTDVDEKTIEWGAVTEAMKSIEILMVPYLAKFAKKYIDNGKIILAITYIESLHMLLDIFRAYNPQYIDGSVNVTDRAKRINIFNNDPSCKVFITTIRTGGAAISLHDTSPSGCYPRYMFVQPTYSIIDLYQCSGRIYRTGITSDAYFYMVYGTDSNHDVQITPILRAIARKKDVLRSLIKQSTLLPGEFPQKYITITDT